ncbi:MAG: Gfo/Idh/MocA family protein [Massiliimalia sp.]|jgi:myo-inositol 2-dehydrogenase/D-chiro-inositol 1-dehydrogenase
MKQLKGAIIGCGGFGNQHLKNLLNMEGVQVIALVNRSRDRLEETVKLVPGARCYQDYREMFEKETDLDFAVISTIPGGHDEIEEMAAAHHIPFYVEKPVGLNQAEMERKEKIVKESGILTSVGYQERYNPDLPELRQWLKQHPVVMAYGGWIGDMPGVSWWRKKESSGGQLVEQCTHIFDMLRYLLGEAKTVSAMSRSDLHGEIEGCDVDDCAVCSVSFENGVVASVMTGCFQKPGTPGWVGFTLVCQDGMVKYDWGKGLTLCTKEGEVRHNFPGDHHYRALQAFVEAVRHGDASLIHSDYCDGVRTAKLTLAAQQAAEQGKIVVL